MQKRGSVLRLRAVIFDYGLVLSGPQEPEALAASIRITGLEPAQFNQLYWKDRLAYDGGQLTGVEYWRQLILDAGVNLSDDAIAELNDLDARMWMTQNPEILQWQQLLKRAGLRTAILSNMGEFVASRIEQGMEWVHQFDVRVWSYQLQMTKPDPRIYSHTLTMLGVKPNEALFLDDRLENVEAARSVGTRALVFSTVEKLKMDLCAFGFDAELPLPV